MSALTQQSETHARFDGRFIETHGALNNYAFAEDSAYVDVDRNQVLERELYKLRQLGIGLDAKAARQMMQMAMDSGQFVPSEGMDTASPIVPQGITPLVTTASIPGLIQYLQTLMPGWVRVATQARLADMLTGVRTIGQFSDEQIIQGDSELTGTPVPYTDNSNIAFASYNVNFNLRTVVRFKLGLEVGLLSQERASRIQLSDDATRRAAVMQGFEILRNAVAWYGFNSGANQTYGILNDPTLPAYTTFAENGASTSTQWADKTYLEICADIMGLVNTMITQTGNQINPTGKGGAQTTLAVGTSTITYLSTQNALGSQSVMQWINETYPNMRVMSAPELDGADGGENAVYFFAERFMGDGSTDGGYAWDQLVPMKIRNLGVVTELGGYKEGYASALAGIITYRPWLFVRQSGN